MHTSLDNPRICEKIDQPGQIPTQILTSRATRQPLARDSRLLVPLMACSNERIPLRRNSNSGNDTLRALAYVS